MHVVQVEKFYPHHVVGTELSMVFQQIGLNKGNVAGVLKLLTIFKHINIC